MIGKVIVGAVALGTVIGLAAKPAAKPVKTVKRNVHRPGTEEDGYTISRTVKRRAL